MSSKLPSIQCLFTKQNISLEETTHEDTGKLLNCKDVHDGKLQSEESEAGMDGNIPFEMWNKRRWQASCREKTMHRRLIQWLHALALCLPAFPSEKSLNQKEILLLAINYIQLLEDLLHGGTPFRKWKTWESIGSSVD